MANHMTFENKVVLITGSSMGIGKATALALGRRGASVVLNGRNPERLRATADSFSKEGIQVLPLVGDVSNAEDAVRLVERTIETFGRLDILINNAGISMRGPMESISDDVIDKVIGSNLLGAIYATREALPHLRTSHGQVIFISSLAGIHGLPMVSVYSAAKMALTGIAESLRLELDGNGVHVGIVYVGITQNEPEKRVLDTNGQPLALKWRGIREGQSREKVAEAVVRLIHKRKFKSVLTGLGQFEAFANRISPTFVEKILRSANGKVEAGFK